jgi:hypothetical protein
MVGGRKEFVVHIPDTFYLFQDANSDSIKAVFNWEPLPSGLERVSANYCKWSFVDHSNPV